MAGCFKCGCACWPPDDPLGCASSLIANGGADLERETVVSVRSPYLNAPLASCTDLALASGVIRLRSRVATSSGLRLCRTLCLGAASNHVLTAPLRPDFLRSDDSRGATPEENAPIRHLQQLSPHFMPGMHSCAIVA
jgi:hypothetical protein